MSKKVEIGKKYQTRDGKPVRVICVDFKNSFYPVIALIEGDGTEVSTLYTAEGRFYESPDSEHKLDLLPVVERIKRDAWINVYPDSRTNLHSAKEDAEKWASGDVQARIRIHIDCEVGEGLTNSEREALGL